MRIESSVTSVSWIPSEAVTGAVLKGTFEAGFTHYDDPPPDAIDDLEDLRDAGSFRFANHLAAWVEVNAGRIVDAGYEGAGMMGRTTVRLAGLRTTFEPVPLPDIRHDPEIRETDARFVQTTGGRTGLPAPRRVKHPPFVQFKAPTVWTTLALTIRADGTSDSEVLGASRFRATGSTTTRAPWRRRWGWPTSRTGTATRSGSTRPGATATRRHWSPRSSRHSSASSAR